MSTRNVAAQAATARQALADLDAAVQARVQEARAEQVRLERERQQTLRASAVALQSIADEDADLAEELMQLDPQQPPAQPPAPPAQDGHTQQLPPVPPQNPNPPAPEPPAQARRNHVDFRQWRGIAWGLAIFGGLIGLFIASETTGFEHHHGTGHDVLIVLWFVFWIGLGFFIGGLVGDMIEERRQNNPGPQHV